MRTTILLTILTLAGETSSASAEPTVTYVGDSRPITHGSPREEADSALAKKRLDEARALYAISLQRTPNDRHALREAGRVAHALGELTEAAALLGRARDLTTTADPELHYLLGEALWALDRKEAAQREHERALVELGAGPHTRLQQLWRARIEGRLGRTNSANDIYERLIAELPADAEAAFALAELHASTKNWIAAERAIRRYLANDPHHPHARAMLAWFLEARGDLEGELAVRADLARTDTHASSTRDYGRALERSGDWAAALAAYRRAHGMTGGDADRELHRALERVDQRMAIEIAGAAIARNDPSAAGLGASAGVAVPFGRASHWLVEVSHEIAMLDDREVYSGDVGAGALLRDRDRFLAIALRLGVIDGDADPARTMGHTRVIAPGVTASASSGLLANLVTFTLDAEAGVTWRETPRTVFEAGRSDGLAGHVYLTPASRLVFDGGAHVRRLRIAPDAGITPRSAQLLAWAGADYALWRNFGREARGQFLDEELLRPMFAADSIIVGYRHYEMWGDTDQMFAARLALADRASIDELSLTLRKVLARGAVTIEGRGGFGRDWVRDLYLSRGSVSLWISPATRQRLSLSFDLARESVRTFAGERRTGSVTYHVDL